MKVSKKVIKTNKFGIKRIIVVLVGVFVIYAAGYTIMQQLALRQEADGFAKLKQDFLALQTEFNKIDPGWEYSEGCRGKGGVYNDNQPSSCSLVLASKAVADYPAIQNKFDDYIKIMKGVSGFQAIGLKNEVRLSISDPTNTTSLTTLHLTNQSFDRTGCDLKDYVLNDKLLGGIKLECHHTATAFHYPRYDR
ncbi:MAG: hypothetical protein WAU02_02495 [Candidatus Saccharimonadales bacterium]